MKVNAGNGELHSAPSLDLQPGFVLILKCFGASPSNYSLWESLTSKVKWHTLGWDRLLQRLFIRNIRLITEINPKASLMSKSATLQTPYIIARERAAKLVYHQHAMHHLLDLISVTVRLVEVLHHEVIHLLLLLLGAFLSGWVCEIFAIIIIRCSLWGTFNAVRAAVRYGGARRRWLRWLWRRRGIRLRIAYLFLWFLLGLFALFPSRAPLAMAIVWRRVVWGGDFFAFVIVGAAGAATAGWPTSVVQSRAWSRPKQSGCAGAKPLIFPPSSSVSPS